jgi:DNA-binding transcriptional MerR regulator
LGTGPELAKLYYRIGEVAQIVGVQPHVLRYWESEFRTIRPRKSNKGQRVYSRRDVEKLLRVKDLLRNQGFTIAGAKRKLRDPAEDPETQPPAGAGGSPALAATTPVTAPAPALGKREVPPLPVPAAPTLAVPAAAVLSAPAPMFSAAAPLPPPRPPGAPTAQVRQALLALREDLAAMLRELGDD